MKKGKAEKTQIGIKLSKELATRFKIFVIQHNCGTYENALRALLDAAEKGCKITENCICIESGAVVSVQVY